MKTDNDLDNFYKRKLEDASVTPPEDVWDTISSRLPEKKSRVLPLWYKIAGTAAVVLLLLNLGQILIAPSPLPTENQTTYTLPTSLYPEIELASKEFDKVMRESSELLHTISQETEKRRLLKRIPGTADESDHLIPTRRSTSSPDRTRTLATGETSGGNSSTGVATNRTAAAPQGHAGSFLDSLGESSDLAVKTSAESDAPKTNTWQDKNAEILAKEKTLAQKTASTQEGTEGSSMPSLTRETEASNNNAPGSIPNLHLKKSVTEPATPNQEVLATSEVGVQQNQGLVHTSEDLEFPGGENAVAAGLENKDFRENRLSISTKVAPVIFKAGGGNALDRQLSANSAAGEVSVSYGVSFAYRISQNIKLRSGVSRVALAYQTQDVGFNAAVNSAAVENSPKTAVLASPMVGNLNQQMGFTEVPVEMEYLITDNRLGLSLLLGASSLFLDENNLSLDAATFSTDLGEANNLNDLSFSANVGLGLNYKLAPKFQLNVEPILKYQLNTFKSSSLRPYYFGIYSGFTFNF